MNTMDFDREELETCLFDSEEFESCLFNKQLSKTGVISEEEVNLILQNGKDVIYQKKDVIFKQGTLTSHAMFIKSGLVKVYKEGHNNKSVIFKIASPGHFIEYISILGENTFQYSAAALEESKIFFIDINMFYSIVESNNRCTNFLLKSLSAEYLYMFDRLISKHQKQLPGKVADLILYFSECIYNSHSFQFPLSRIELAEFVGTTRESLIRVLSEFKNDKIIDLDGKLIKINSIVILKTLSKIG